MTLPVDDTADIDEVLEHYQYLQCRKRHEWVQQHDSWMVEGIGPQQIYTLTSVCDVCGTKRIERVSNRFKRLPMIYRDYPEGFRAEPGHSFKRSDIWRWEIQQMLAVEEQKAQRLARRKQRGGPLRRTPRSR